MDNQSIQHTRWNCTYHIVFIPKYRRKIKCGETKRDIVEIIKKLCEMKQVQLIDGKVCGTASLNYAVIFSVFIMFSTFRFVCVFVLAACINKYLTALL